MRDDEILAVLRAHGPMTARQIATVHGDASYDTLVRARRHLRSLHKFRMVEVVGEVRESQYRNVSRIWKVVE